MSGIPTWSNIANLSMGLFYRELQQIEIYVEDSESEALYHKLLGRAVDGEVKIKKVIPLNGRTNVVEHCRNYNEKFPALFIIDGDLDLLNGEREESLERLYQHKLYCMENYLFCPTASAELMQDGSGRLTQEEATEQLNWDEFTAPILEPLLDLFKVYAVTWKLKPELPTVSRSYYTMCHLVTRRRGNELCLEKVNKTINELKNRIIEDFGDDVYQQTYNVVTNAIDELGSPFNAISGKDYLLRALRDYLDYKGVSIKFDDGFKFRLARYCNLEPLNDLKNAIITTANEGPYVYAS